MFAKLLRLILNGPRLTLALALGDSPEARIALRRDLEFDNRMHIVHNCIHSHFRLTTSSTTWRARSSASRPDASRCAVVRSCSAVKTA